MIYQRQLAVPGYWEDITREQWEKAKREDTRVLYTAEPVAQGEAMAKVRHFDYRGIARNGFSQEAEMLDGAPVLPDGTMLYAIPATSSSPAAVPSVPDGWKLVPREPTDEMLKAAYPLHWFDSPGQRLKHDYKAMLAAAPSPGESS